MAWCDEVLGFGDPSEEAAGFSSPEATDARLAYKERDGDSSALFDFQHELVNNDPLVALELKVILSIEDDPRMLAVLAAGMLEDLVPAEDGPVIDAVVAEADRDPRFRHLLGGVWFTSMSPEVVERLEKARGEIRW
ncbi:MAG: DUF6869 domain-containing protein [Methyloceanibacter sp.]